MAGIYLFAKPPADVAAAIDRLRALLGIDRCYARGLLHTTFLRLPEDVPDTILSAILATAIAALAIGPFALRFDRVSRAALTGRGMADAGDFQRRLVRSLIAGGLTLPDYRFRPHLQLAYAGPAATARTIAPIGWLVEEVLLIRSVRKEHELIARLPLAVRQPSFTF